MATELKKTELDVRMDCNGCMRKIEKARHGVDGIIYEWKIDFPRQKLTVIGTAEPEKIVKAIKKRRKIATICSHTEVREPAPADEQPPPPPADEPSPDTSDSAAPAEATPLAETPKEETPVPAPEPSPETALEAKEVAAEKEEVIHMVHHYPHSEYVVRHGDHWHDYYPAKEHVSGTHQAIVAGDPGPYYSMRSYYNNHRPSPYVSGYVYTPPSPARDYYYWHDQHSREGYTDDHYYNHYYYNGRSSSSEANVSSMFSDENPNACSIV